MISNKTNNDVPDSCEQMNYSFSSPEHNQIILESSVCVYTIELDQIDVIESTVPISLNETLTKTERKHRQLCSKFLNYLKEYFKRFLGMRHNRPPRVTWNDYLWTLLGSFISVALLAFLHHRVFAPRQLIALIGSFGASAVILFATPSSPYGQPRNLIGGHIIGAVCGCLVRLILNPYEQSIASALAVVFAAATMQFTETFHPPGGASALIAVTIDPELPWKNFMFVFVPISSGAMIMLFCALVINNICAKRQYPSYWW